MSSCLIKIEKQGKTEAKRLEGERFTFGRALENSIVLQHESISRNHLEMAVRKGKIYLKDLGSSNGSYLNGKKLKPNEIKEYVLGDVLRLGHSEYAIQIELPAEPVALPVMSVPLEVPAVAFSVPTELAPEPSVVAAKLTEDTIRKAEQAARAAVAKIHEEARANLETSQAKARKELEEARSTAQRITDEARVEASKIIESTKQAAAEMEKTSEALLAQSKESVDKLVSLKLQEAEEEKKENLKKWEKQHESLQQEINAFRQKLDEKKIQHAQALDLEKQAQENLKKRESEISAADDQLKQKKSELQQQESRIEQLKARVEGFERQLSELKKEKEEGLLAVKSLQGKAKADQEALEKDYQHQKERIRVEMAELRQKELSDIQKLRFDELDNLDKLRRQAVSDIQRNQNTFTKGLSDKIEAYLLKSLKDVSPGSKQVNKSELDRLVFECFNEQIFEIEQGFDKDIRAEVKVATQVRKSSLKKVAGFFAGVSATFVLLFVFQGGNLWNAIQGMNEAGLTAAEQYSRKMYQERSSSKFQPQQVPGLKASYTDNVLYTPFYVERVQDKDTREKWIKILNRFLTRELALEDDSVVQLVAIESTMVSRLKAERDQINPQYVDISIKKMQKLEQESSARIRHIFKSQTQYERYLALSKSFWGSELNDASKFDSSRLPANK